MEIDFDEDRPVTRYISALRLPGANSSFFNIVCFLASKYYNVIVRNNNAINVTSVIKFKYTFKNFVLHKPTGLVERFYNIIV